MDKDATRYAKDTGCCLDPNCPTDECPEPMCAMEFPGGIQAYLRHKETMEQLRTDKDLVEIGKALSLSKRATEKRYNKISGR